MLRRIFPTRVISAGAGLMLVLQVACVSDGNVSISGTGGRAAGGAGSGSGSGPGGTAGTGATGGSTAGTGGITVPPIPPGPGPQAIAACTPDGQTKVGPTPLRRISGLEYRNAVRDLFADTTDATTASGFPSDEKVGSFVSNTKTTLSPTNNEGYMGAAESVASRFVAKFATASGCAVTDATCTEKYLLALARRAFHGTIDIDASTALKALHTKVRGMLDGNAAVDAVVRTILLSPRFLFVIENGTAGADAATLTPQEVAGRLASFLWRSVPDQPLLDIADSGGLATAAQIAQRAEMMLGDARGLVMMDDFVLQWLEIVDIGRISRDDAAFTPALRDAMSKEITLVFENAVSNSATSFAQLLTSNTSYINGDLATLYGATAPATAFASAQLPDNRRGILTRAAFLSVNAHPQTPSQVLRGKAVREQLLCDRIPAPPPGVERNVPVGSTQTAQEAVDAHTSAVACAGCHKWLDPIGYAFNAYDNIGRYREMENGKAVNVQGEIVKGPSSPITGKFSGAYELEQMLSTNEYVQQCFTIQAARFALGRDEGMGDACSLKTAWDAFSAGGQFSIRQLLVAVTGTYAFSHRNNVRAGEACR
jgi:hypothetical protein